MCLYVCARHKVRAISALFCVLLFFLYFAGRCVSQGLRAAAGLDPVTGRVIDGRANLMCGYSTNLVVHDKQSREGEKSAATAAAEDDDDPLMLL